MKNVFKKPHFLIKAKKAGQIGQILGGFFFGFFWSALLGWIILNQSCIRLIKVKLGNLRFDIL